MMTTLASWVGPARRLALANKLPSAALQALRSSACKGSKPSFTTLSPRTLMT